MWNETVRVLYGAATIAAVWNRTTAPQNLKIGPQKIPQQTSTVAPTHSQQRCCDPAPGVRSTQRVHLVVRNTTGSVNVPKCLELDSRDNPLTHCHHQNPRLGPSEQSNDRYWNPYLQHGRGCGPLLGSLPSKVPAHHDHSLGAPGTPTPTWVGPAGWVPHGTRDVKDNQSNFENQSVLQQQQHQQQRQQQQQQLQQQQQIAAATTTATTTSNDSNK